MRDALSVIAFLLCFSLASCRTVKQSYCLSRDTAELIAHAINLMQTAAYLNIDIFDTLIIDSAPSARHTTIRRKKISASSNVTRTNEQNARKIQTQTFSQQTKAETEKNVTKTPFIDKYKRIFVLFALFSAFLAAFLLREKK